MNDWQLPQFPGPDSHDEIHQVALLLLPQLLQILIGSHKGLSQEIFFKKKLILFFFFFYQ
jgi:hypothetical protein